jgi:shikimate kinase
MKRHILLVGLPGSGKSTVGALVAAALETGFVDLDSTIEQLTGVTIARLFARDGERHFRALERAEMLRLLCGPPCVVATGGGWAAQPGNLEAAEAALLVYLAVSPEVAAERVSRAPGVRPLLEGRGDSKPAEGDPQPSPKTTVPPTKGNVVPRATMEQLLAARRAYYDRCDAQVDANRADPAAVALQVVKLARSLAGW